MISDMDRYLFDLRGYIILRAALSAAEVDELNAGLDAMPRLQPGEWHGYVHGHTYGTKDGRNYQQIYEGGEPFEKLIDHPAWFEHMKTFVGGEGGFDYHHGPLFIDECFVNFRQPGEAIGMHSGATIYCKRNQYRNLHQKFMCGQVNALMALTDIGPGDGATMVVPASHKQNYVHPQMAEFHMKYGGASGDGMVEAIEVHLNKGDVLVFSDAICHGSAKRTNPGERRIIVYRYGPSWGNFRHGYLPSPELLQRLTPQRRNVVWPQQPLLRPPQVDANADVKAGLAHVGVK